MAPKKAEPIKKDEAAAKPRREAPKETEREAELRRQEKELEASKPAQPDRAAFDKLRAKKEEEISAVIDRLKQLHKDIEAQASGGVEDFPKRRNALRKEMDAAAKKVGELETERDGLREQMRSIVREERAKREVAQQKKREVGALTEEQIDAEISRIEYQMSISSMSLKEERDMMKKLGDLRAKKPELKRLRREATAAAAAAASSPDAKAGPQARLDALDGELKAAWDAKRAAGAKLRALMQERDKAMAGMPEKQAERDALEKKKRALISERNKMWDENRAAQKAHWDWWEQVKVLRDERKALEDERWRKERALRAAERAADREEEPPMLAEKVLVEQVRTYLRNLLPEAGPAETGPAAEVAYDAPEGFSVHKTKGEDFYFAPSKRAAKDKKASGGKASRGKDKVTHSLASLQLFAHLKVPAPATVAEVETVLAAVAEKEKEILAKAEKLTQDRERKRAAAVATVEQAKVVAVEA